MSNQPASGRCPWCPAVCNWTPTDSPWEFRLACTAGHTGVTSWAHVDSPPTFELDAVAPQMDLFREVSGREYA